MQRAPLRLGVAARDVFRKELFCFSPHPPRLETNGLIDIGQPQVPDNPALSLPADPLTIDIDVNINIKAARDMDSDVGRGNGLAEC